MNQQCKNRINFNRKMAINSPSPSETSKMFLTEPNTNSCIDCLYTKLRGYLILGKFLGIVPMQGLFETNGGVEHLKFRNVSVQTITCISFSLVMLVCLVIGFIGMVKQRNVFETADLPILYLGGFFNYIYFLQGSKPIIEMLQKWMSIKLHFTREDTKLGRDIFLISGIIFTSATLVNFPFYLSMFNLYKTQEKSFLIFYYEFELKNWASVLPYQPVLVVFMIGAEQFLWFAWNYGDTFLILMARALHFKFEFLWEKGKSQKSLAIQNSKGMAENRFWIHLSKDIDTLCNQVEQVAEILSPLVFVSYAINTIELSLSIYAVLTGATGDDALYSTSLFLHNVGRFFFLHLIAARMNGCICRIAEVFWDCPNECYSLDIQRIVQRLSSRQIGFHGLNCFYITKPLFLTVLSTLFTIQIFLLEQASRP